MCQLNSQMVLKNQKHYWFGPNLNTHYKIQVRLKKETDVFYSQKLAESYKIAQK